MFSTFRNLGIILVTTVIAMVVGAMLWPRMNTKARKWILASLAGAFSIGVIFASLPAPEVTAEEEPVPVVQVVYVEVPKNVEIKRSEILSALKEIGEFAACESDYTYTEEVTDFYTLFDHKVPLTSNTITMVCPGTVKAGYVVKDVNFEIDHANRKVRFAIGKASVLDNYVDTEHIQCEVKKNIFNPTEYEQFQRIMDTAKQQGLADAERKGIYAKAEASFKAQLSELIQGLNPDYEVVFM